jgi:hypothetical protein
VKLPSPTPSEDPANIPSDLDDLDAERELERRWNALERGEPSNAPIPAERQYVSPFVFTSDEEPSEDEDEDPSFLPPSTSERSQPRPRKSNPSLPTSRGLCVGSSCSRIWCFIPCTQGKGQGDRGVG